MNKGDLINAVAEQTEMTKAASEQALNATIDVIKGALSGGDSVTLIGFGTFSTSKRAEKKGRNPRTGEEITIPAATIPAFKAGKALKETVNQ